MVDLNSATRMLEVIGQEVQKNTKSGAGIELTYGQVFGIDAPNGAASVYLAGSRELAASDGGVPEPSDDFRLPSFLNINASDYVRVSMDDRGHRWIEDVLPVSLYSKVSLDPTNGKIMWGDGTATPTMSQEYWAAGSTITRGITNFRLSYTGLDSGNSLQILMRDADESSSRVQLGWALNPDSVASSLLAFGPGGAAARDTSWWRGGADLWKTNDKVWIVGLANSTVGFAGARALDLDSAATSTQTQIGLRVAGTDRGLIRVDSTGNLVVEGTSGLYLNWEMGTGGVIVGNGSSAAVMTVAPSGAITLTNPNFYSDNQFGYLTVAGLAQKGRYLGVYVGTNYSDPAAPSAGIQFGPDVDLYRSSADVLQTDDNFYASGWVQSLGDMYNRGGTLYFWSGSTWDTYVQRAGAGTIGLINLYATGYVQAVGAFYRGSDAIIPVMGIPLIAYSSSALTMSTTATDIAGATITYTPPVAEVVFVTGVFDFNVTTVANTIAIGYLLVDGSAQTATAAFKVDGGTVARGTVTQTWVISLSAAAHTLKLQAAKSASGGGFQASGTISIQRYRSVA